jgi:hypothetical protein
VTAAISRRASPNCGRAVPNRSSEKRWPHQAHEFQIGREKRSRALIWPMRSGKSRACIDVACYNHKQRRPGRLVEGVIVIAPNGVHLNWARNEIPTWGALDIAHRTFAWETTKSGTPEKQRAWTALLRHQGLKWFCVNMDALRREDNKRAIKEFLRACHGNFMLIVSESHHFGRPISYRTRRARSLAWHANFVRIESGTPILTGPLRAFSQFELLAPGALGFRRYREFQDHYAELEPAGPPGPRQRMRVKRYLNIPELTRKIGDWSSLVLREDMGDMPELIRTDRPVVLGPAQRVAYNQMVAMCLAEVEDVQVEVPDAGPRMQKLQQMLSGFVMDSRSRRVLTIDTDAPIFDAVIEQIEGTLPGKALVWCRFKEECRRLEAKLRSRRMKTLSYWGDYPSAVREENRRQFLDPRDTSTMIGTPDCGGEGLDFSTAAAVIFMSGNPNARMMAQAEERATVKGGKSVSVVRIRHYGTVDDRIWAIVDGNITLADSITGHGLRSMLLETDV